MERKPEEKIEELKNCLTRIIDFYGRIKPSRKGCSCPICDARALIKEM